MRTEQQIASAAALIKRSLPCLQGTEMGIRAAYTIAGINWVLGISDEFSDAFDDMLLGLRSEFDQTDAKIEKWKGGLSQ